ncbi:MAG: hydroxyphenylacetyl-CoA thioesterase PaaI [Anaerolineae bacterium]|nr:hydroxyphenylacetyl-CoA thioesterase PaaI [Anaerolineae bacterium]
MSLEQILQRIEQDPFARFLGIELLELCEGYSKTTLVVKDHMLNFHGLPHGGVIFSLADAAFAAACNSYGQVAVALHVDISFLDAVEVGTRLVAEAAEEHLGGRTGLYRLAVTREDGALVALAHGTAYRKKQLLLQDDET